MKRSLIMFTALFLLIFSPCAFAVATDTDSVPEPTTQDMSAPRLMVTSFTVDNGCVTPGEKTDISITFKNTNGFKSIRNAKLSLSDSSGDIEFDGMGTSYISYIGPGCTYTWETSLSAVYTAGTGKHEITVEGEYEDVYFASYHSSDVLKIDIKQSVNLDFDNVLLPVKVVQGDTVTVSVNLMNTGKTALSNVKLEYTVPGLTTGGSTFVGEIPIGENKTAGTNFRVDDGVTGETEGMLTVTYEDTFGKSYTKTEKLSTIIEKKTEKEEVAEPEEESLVSKIKWWIWLTGGLVLGGIASFGITAGVYSSKLRKIDELRL